MKQSRFYICSNSKFGKSNNLKCRILYAAYSMSNTVLWNNIMKNNNGQRELRFHPSTLRILISIRNCDASFHPSLHFIQVFISSNSEFWMKWGIWMKWSFWMKWSITISYRNENCEMTLEKFICQFVYWESPLKIFFNQKLPFSAPNTCNFSQYWQCWKTRNISCGRGRGPNLKNLAKIEI